MAQRIDFKKFVQEFRKEKVHLPKILGNIALRHFLQSFRDGGFTDNNLTKWKKRKRADRTAAKRAILVDSGNLRNSLKRKSANFRSIRVGSYGIKYAQKHNRGLDGMPQRQFIGKSAKLRKKMEKRISKAIDQVFR